MYHLYYHSSVTGFFSSSHAPNMFAIKYQDRVNHLTCHLYKEHYQLVMQLLFLLTIQVFYRLLTYQLNLSQLIS